MTETMLSKLSARQRTPFECRGAEPGRTSAEGRSAKPSGGCDPEGADGEEEGESFVWLLSLVTGCLGKMNRLLSFESSP